MTIRCVDLRCERSVDPIGLDTRTPRFTWRLEADAGETDVVQQAHEVEVDNGWATGRVESWRQQVSYDGPALTSRARLKWRVRVSTNVGDTEWSAWTPFEIGILRAEDWVARMVTAAVETPVVRFTKTINIPDDVTTARLRLTAHGIVTATVDGVDVSDEALAPGWTTYHQRLAVRTYDVTSLLHAGELELSALVAPGWFSGRIGWENNSGFYGSHRGLLAQLELERRDGSLVVIGTDETWTATSTPYLAADFYDGETYDARRGYGHATPVWLVDLDPALLCAPPVRPVRRTQTVAPVTRDGNVLDFGQNLVGWVRLRVRGVAAGTEIVLRHAEVLDAQGRLFTEPLRTAKATDVYVAAGSPEETYEPRFTFHGFRYAEITGIDLDRVDVEAVVIHSDLDRIGTFECSEPLLNRLHENVVWGLRGNFVSVPTDCPQRDERLGWTGDAQVFAPTASFLYDCEMFWENWLADLAADQMADGAVPVVVPAISLKVVGAAGWGDAATVVPWSTYVAYGDDTVLRRALPSMRAWVDYIWTRLDESGLWSGDFQFGDWLDPDAPAERPWDGKASPVLVATAYAARSATLLARAAAVVGDESTASAASARAASARRTWWRHYVDEAPRTQTGAALAIAFGLAPDEAAVEDLGAALVKRVADAGGHLSTGFLGTPLLLPALTATGHVAVAYDVLLQRTTPSWLYQVLAGATTIWERWDALRPDGSVVTGAGDDGGGSMVSFNHYAYGAVAEWLHAAVAGLAPDPNDPGYHHVIVEPRPGGGLTSASASLESRFGKVRVAWALEDGELRCDVELPPNTSATVRLPGRDPLRLGSGRHSFQAGDAQ